VVCDGNSFAQSDITRALRPQQRIYKSRGNLHKDLKGRILLHSALYENSKGSVGPFAFHPATGRKIPNFFHCRALSPRANYTDRATSTCRRNLLPTFVDGGVSRGQDGGFPTVVNLSFLDRSRYFSFKKLLIYSHKS
jgi:hypothetical protein